MDEYEYAQGLMNMEPWYIKYLWEILALTVAPLTGFVIGQYYKANVTPKPGTMRIALVAGGVTALGVIMCWTENHSLTQAAKIALLVGPLQPLVVWGWLVVADKVAPGQAAKLRGDGDELTVLPWVTAKVRNGPNGGST